MKPKYSAFQLVQHSLLNFSFEKNKKFDPANTNINLILNAEKDIQKDDAQKLASVQFTFSIFDKKMKKDAPFIMEITMEGTFKWDDTMTSEAVDDLLNANAPAILLGYMRPFIAQITAYSGYSPLILPLIDFSRV